MQKSVLKELKTPNRNILSKDLQFFHNVQSNRDLEYSNYKAEAPSHFQSTVSTPDFIMEPVDDGLNETRRAAHVKWDGKTIALGTFTAAEAAEKCERAKALTKKWRATMVPKPEVEWVKKALEELQIRVVNDRPGRRKKEQVLEEQQRAREHKQKKAMMMKSVAEQMFHSAGGGGLNAGGLDTRGDTSQFGTSGVGTNNVGGTYSLQPSLNDPYGNLTNPTRMPDIPTTTGLSNSDFSRRLSNDRGFPNRRLQEEAHPAMANSGLGHYDSVSRPSFPGSGSSGAATGTGTTTGSGMGPSHVSLQSQSAGVLDNLSGGTGRNDFGMNTNRMSIGSGPLDFTTQLGSLDAGVGVQRLPTPSRQHYQILREHHDNLLKELQQTTYMMEMYQNFNFDDPNISVDHDKSLGLGSVTGAGNGMIGGGLASMMLRNTTNDLGSSAGGFGAGIQQRRSSSMSMRPVGGRLSMGFNNTINSNTSTFPYDLTRTSHRDSLDMGGFGMNMSDFHNSASRRESLSMPNTGGLGGTLSSMTSMQGNNLNLQNSLASTRSHQLLGQNMQLSAIDRNSLGFDRRGSLSQIGLKHNFNPGGAGSGQHNRRISDAIDAKSKRIKTENSPRQSGDIGHKHSESIHANK